MSAFQPLRDLLDLDNRLPTLIQPEATHQELVAAAAMMLATDGIGRILSRHPTRSLPHTVAHLVFDLLLIEHLVLFPDADLDIALKNHYPRASTRPPEDLITWQERLSSTHREEAGSREGLARYLSYEVGSVIKEMNRAEDHHLKDLLPLHFSSTFAMVCTLATQASISMKEPLIRPQHSVWEERLARMLRLP